MKYIKTLLYSAVAAMMLLTSCAPTHENEEQVNHLPNMFPDYADITIPVNIAPLNFMVRDKNLNSIEVVATIMEGANTPESTNENSLTVANKGNVVQFGLNDWKDFLQKAAGKKINVQVYTCSNQGYWTAFKPFTWEVANDSIDPYLSYQLIEPDYKVWNKIQIKERCVEDFNEKILADHNLQKNNCMNCHIPGNQDPNLSMIFLAEDGRNALLYRNGQMRKLNINTAGMVTPATYYGFSPSGRYITFSTNEYEPAFHASANQRVEVYDKKSDVYVADLDHNNIISSPLTCNNSTLATFPVFSPNGKYIYYCVSSNKGIVDNNIKKLQYALVRIPFDETSGRFGNQVDTLYSTRSVCHPKISPDGRYCLFTVADYGTCPAWHPEADLCMLDLQTNKLDTLGIVNSKKSDTYHSWSHNSRWFVFGSKRDDGVYTKPYICYFDRHGKAHKPFLLPQKNPAFYDYCMKCFNTLELYRGTAPFNAFDLESVQKKTTETFK